ncbi:MAG: hypothetical protein IANPNBLG_05034 [Bryobacteraceae bacterium]|nr:hypothetical protein [Bryobacteraceae bacterium]
MSPVAIKNPAHGLDAEYQWEADRVSEAEWYELLDLFDDANIYQTCAYEGARGGQPASRLILKQGEDVVAMAQARIVRVPLVKIAVAYVRWGPLWKRRGRPANPGIFRQALRALRAEYVSRRDMTLRLLPVVFQDASTPFNCILAEEGFTPVGIDRPDRTLMLDVSRPVEEIRADLKPHWRRKLKSTEKAGLEIIECVDEESFRKFVTIYGEMVLRKKFVKPNDIEHFVQMQRRLPDRFKLQISLCKLGDTLCAGLISSALGKTAIYLFGATSDMGLNVGGAYALHWRLIEGLREKGVDTYDLNGINPVENPGTYRFKSDLCGGHGRDTHFLGRFEAHPGVRNRSCIFLGDGVRAVSRALRRMRSPAH